MMEPSRFVNMLDSEDARWYRFFNKEVPNERS
jgi:hypothetical protein